MELTSIFHLGSPAQRLHLRVQQNRVQTQALVNWRMMYAHTRKTLHLSRLIRHAQRGGALEAARAQRGRHHMWVN